MQTTSAVFTAAEKNTFRQVSASLLISWHVQSILSSKTFTIGVSLIGGNDLIGINPGAIGSPSNYKYFDESAYIQSLGWERGYNMPEGGLSMGLAEAVLDNTSGRFTPRYMGGKSELSTAIIPQRPAIINAGFNISGVDSLLPQFAGIFSDQPSVSVRDKLISLKMADYISYFQNKYLDQTVMFTSQFTDQVLKILFTDLGMSTSQYRLDSGINLIPFGVFDVGTKFSDAIGQLVQAENGHLYQDESGVFRFENRQHWSNAPYNSVQKVITTSQVIDAEAPNEDHLINIVEITGGIYEKQPAQVIYTLPILTTIAVPPNGSYTQFFQFQDPILQITDPTAGGLLSYLTANSAPDNSGIDLTANVSVKNNATFSQNVKYTFSNSSNLTAYITQLVITGRVAKRTSDLYYREQDDSSVTAYQAHDFQLNNDFIQNYSWAQTYAEMLLNDFSNIENLQTITIRAMPDLQLGDLISWQGKYWRIFDIKTTLNAAQGFTQQLTLLQRNIVTYFRIGISTIGGSDLVSP